MNFKKAKLPQYGLYAMSMLLVLMVVSGALSEVWLRQQISKSAQFQTELEHEIIELDRRQTYLESRIAQLHNPEQLKKRVKNRLNSPKKNQIVWVLEPKRATAEDMKAMVAMTTREQGLRRKLSLDFDE